METSELIQNSLLIIHLIGFATLFGLLIAQIGGSGYVIKKGMIHGALTQLVTGLILAVMQLSKISSVAAAAKTTILLIILGVLFYNNRKEDKALSKQSYRLLLALTILEAVVAVFWLSIETE